MTYTILEASVASGEPIEVYRFVVGSAVYRYTSYALPVTMTFEGVPEEYLPTAIARSSIAQSQEQLKAALELRMSRDVAIADLFRDSTPAEIVLISVYRTHAGLNDFKVVWLGRVLNATFNGPEATLTCESVYTSLKRIGLRRAYQRTCPHSLYSPACGVNKAGFVQTLQVTGVAGSTVTLAGLSNYGHHFAGGYVEFPVGRRPIVQQNGDQVTLPMAVRGLLVGHSADVYPGCDHTLQVCNDRFNNVDNYGGFPFIPRLNPFGNSPIY